MSRGNDLQDNVKKYLEMIRTTSLTSIDATWYHKKIHEQALISSESQ